MTLSNRDGTRRKVIETLN